MTSHQPYKRRLEIDKLNREIREYILDQDLPTLRINHQGGRGDIPFEIWSDPVQVYFDFETGERTNSPPSGGNLHQTLKSKGDVNVKGTEVKHHENL